LEVGKNGPKLTASTGESLATGMLRRVVEGQVRISAKAQPLSELTRALENQLGPRVIDKTGLTGKYDFHLEFAPQNVNGPDDNAPGIFSAVRDQLGLRLEKRTGPLDILIVDHANRVPTEN
jgi:uncharacterized protein (TIGR03435 family)